MKKITTTILFLSISLMQFSSAFACEPEASVKAARETAKTPATKPAPSVVVASAKASVAAVAKAIPAKATPTKAKAVKVKASPAKTAATKPAVAKTPAVIKPAESPAVVDGSEGVTQQDPRAGKILNEMSKKYQALKAYSASFTQTLENPAAKIKETMKGDIVVMGNKFKLSMNGQEVINNGSTIWTYMKNENEVNISDYDPSEEEISPTAIYNMYKKGYKYTFVKEEKRGGQVYEVIELTPEERNNPIFKVELVINKMDKSLDSWKMFRNNGNRYTYNITKFQPNPTVAAVDFNFDKAKYKGVKVIDLR